MRQDGQRRIEFERLGRTFHEKWSVGSAGSRLFRVVDFMLFGGFRAVHAYLRAKAAFMAMARCVSCR